MHGRVVPFALCTSSQNCLVDDLVCSPPCSASATVASQVSQEACEFLGPDTGSKEPHVQAASQSTNGAIHSKP